jgi:hypothetical protein
MTTSGTIDSTTPLVRPAALSAPAKADPLAVLAKKLADGVTQGLVAGIDRVNLRKVIVPGNHQQFRFETMVDNERGEQFTRLHLHLWRIQFSIGN